jgi:tryptophan 2,3-dioxygenase
VPEQSLAAAVRGIDRMTELLKAPRGDHFALMETMTTRDYLAFRDKLNPASGFQSAQLREIEILARAARRGPHPARPRAELHGDAAQPRRLAVERVAARRARLEDTPTLRDAVHEWLYRTPIQGSTPDHTRRRRDGARLHRGVLRRPRARSAIALALALERVDLNADETESGSRALRQGDRRRARVPARRGRCPRRAARDASRIRAALVFIESYRELPLLAWPRGRDRRLVAFEQSFVLFRQRHARMVERVIGRRTGTGGSRRRRLPRPDGAALPNLPRRVGGAHAARPTARAPAGRARELLRLRRTIAK